jgi:hypothetical protein
MASMPAPAELPECPARNAIRAISTIRLALPPARISNSMRRAGVISDRGWSREFDDPIVLPEGEKLRTLRDAATYVTGLPKKEAALPEMAGRDRGAHTRRRSRRPNDVRSHWYDETLLTRRAPVRFLTQGKASRQTQTRARSMKQEAVEVADESLAPSEQLAGVAFAQMHTPYPT